MQSLLNNFNNVKQQIHEAVNHSQFRQPIELIAVSKNFSTTAIKELYEYGQRAFAESYALEFTNKALELQHLDVEWHYIGNLQSNKIKYITPFACWIHSIDKISQITTINKYRQDNPQKLNLLIQINLSNSDGRHGININDINLINDLAETINQCEKLELRGLMGIASNTTDINQVNHEFATLHDLFDKMKYTKFSNMDSLSMGMSNDFKIAILNGATHLRIGSSIFGQRNYAN